MSKPELYWKPGDRRPHEDEEPFVEKFRKAVNARYGYDLQDWWALHDWSTKNTNEFLDFCWDYFKLIGERGDGPAFVEGIPMDEPQKLFPGAKFNVAENILLGTESALRKDKWAMIATVEGDPNAADPHEPVEMRRISYYDLYHEARVAAHALRKMGVQPGDSVASFAATSCEMLIIFMATVAIGAIFSSTPAEFGVKAVVDRYDIIKPKVLFTIDRYRYAGKEHSITERARAVVDEIAKAGKLKNVVTFGQLSRDRQPAPETLEGYPSSVKSWDWASFMESGKDAPAEIDFYRGDFSHPIWIVFSSGTTGKPKSIYGPGGGIYLMRRVVITLHLNLDHRDSYIQFATMGWIVWNMHIMFSCNGGTIVAFDGSPFHPQDVLFRAIDRYRVTQLGASPRYIQTLNKAGVSPSKKHDLSTLKQFYTTGAPVTGDVYDFCARELNRLLVNNAAGGTELGGSYLQSTPVLPAYKGELQTPVLGVSVIAADANQKPLVGEEGILLFTQPFPNMPYNFVDDPDRKRYKEAYFEDSSNPPMLNMNDAVRINPATRGWTVIGRADGVLNPSGVRFGSSELYFILEKDFASEVEDSLAVGQRMPNNDERVVLFLKTRNDTPLSADLVGRIKQAIRRALSNRHVPAIVTQCPAVPLTGSGKKVEPSVKKLLNGVPLEKVNFAGVENPESYAFYAEWARANSGREARL